MRFKTQNLLTGEEFTLPENLSIPYVDQRDLLTVVLSRYVLPKLDQKSRTLEFRTQGSPIRIVAIDGQAVDPTWADASLCPLLTPTVVDVDDHMIRATAAELAR